MVQSYTTRGEDHAYDEQHRGDQRRGEEPKRSRDDGVDIAVLGASAQCAPQRKTFLMAVGKCSPARALEASISPYFLFLLIL